MNHSATGQAVPVRTRNALSKRVILLLVCNLFGSQSKQEGEKKKHHKNQLTVFKGFYWRLLSATTAKSHNSIIQHLGSP